MQDFAGRVAVITGGASGIGRGLAERLAAEGMRVVLADVDAASLDEAASALRAAGAEVERVETDVSSAEQVEALAQIAFDRFGAVHVLCNNAGVAADRTSIWETDIPEWEWVLGVNLMSVVYGLRSFLPRMIAQGEPGHVVNTASIAGLMAGSTAAMYSTSKHAVVALSESLRCQLDGAGSAIGVSLLCPGWVRTRIHESIRSRPAHLPDPPPLDAAGEQRRDLVRERIADGIAPSEVAQAVLEAIRSNRFYILTHPEMSGVIEARFGAILRAEDEAPAVGKQIHARR